MLMVHNGWNVAHSKVYYPYSRKWSIINRLMAYCWRTRHYEGFWGAILGNDLTFAN